MRPFVVTTASGVATCTGWWSRLRVEGCSLVLDYADRDSAPEAVLVVANLPSVGEAQALFQTITDRIAYRGTTFDVRDWPSLARDPVSEGGT